MQKSSRRKSRYFRPNVIVDVVCEDVGYNIQKSCSARWKQVSVYMYVYIILSKSALRYN